MCTRLTRFLTSISLCCLVTLSVSAQDESESNSTWSYLVEPYLMIPYMNGTAGVGNLPDITVDANASDILSNLKMAAMLYAEAHNDDWAIGSDIIYMNLKQDVSTGTIITGGSLQAKQFAWEISGFRKVLPWLDVGVGGRLNSIYAGVDLTTNIQNGTDRSKSLTETWFDPIIIARFHNLAGEKLLYQFRGDIGGFGVGSQFAWQIQAYVGYSFSHLFQMSAGYRIISMDYIKGSGENRFLYDVNTSGPVIRLGFNL